MFLDNIFKGLGDIQNHFDHTILGTSNSGTISIKQLTNFLIIER